MTDRAWIARGLHGCELVRPAMPVDPEFPHIEVTRRHRRRDDGFPPGPRIMSDAQSQEPPRHVITLRETVRKLGVDRDRLEALGRERGATSSGAIFSPSFLCVVLFRLSHYLFVRGHNVAARLVWQLNLFLTGADISPICNLGEGLVVVHSVAATICGSAGAGLTVEGLGGLGGGLGLEDIGAGPGLPLLGDNVHLARGASVLGPVLIGSNVRVGPGCTVVRDLPEGAVVDAHEVRVRRRIEAKCREGDGT